MPNTYGDNGNRWWVGYNTAQGDLAKFPSLSGPSGYEAVPSGNAADDALFVRARARWASGAHANTDTTSIENINWLVPGGPYTTKAAAAAAIPGIQAANPAPGALQQAANSAVPGLSDTASAITDIWAKVRDGKMWRSLGWLALGVFLMILGLILWVGPSAFKASPYGRAIGAVRGAGR